MNKNVNEQDFAAVEARLILSLNDAASSRAHDHKNLHKGQDRFTNLVRGDGFINSNTHGGSFCLGVVKHPDAPKRVFKICTTDTHSDAYFMYIQWVHENNLWKTNPHFPRVYGIDYINDGKMAVVALEELQEWAFESAPSYYDSNIEPDFLENDWRLAATLLGNKYNPKPSDGYTNRPLKTAATSIFEEFSSGGVRFDLHRCNVMMRGEVMVIIDPIV